MARISLARPLPHPQANDVPVAGIQNALADAVRHAIVTELLQADADMNRIETMPKSTGSAHFRLLREVGVIERERKGVAIKSRVRLRERDSRFPVLLASILKSCRRDGIPDRGRTRG